MQQTVEVSREPGPFQPELEGPPWCSSGEGGAPTTARPGSVPGWELRSHMPCGTANTHTETHTEQKPRSCVYGTQQRDMGSGAGKRVRQPQPETVRLLPRSGLREAGQVHLRPQHPSPLACLPRCVPRTPDPIGKSTNWLRYPAL